MNTTSFASSALVVLALAACGDDSSGEGSGAATGDAASSTGGGGASGTGGTTPGTGGTTPGTGGATNPVACPPGATLSPGDHTIDLAVGDLARSFYLHVPASYAGTAGVPLVVDMHPFLNFLPGDAADRQRDGSGWRELSDTEGFIVAHPQGIDRAWNLGTCCTESRTVDDVAFIEALVERVKQDTCVDPKRVYATGYSNGGGLAHLLACRSADVFAAVAPASFDLIEEIMPCTPSRPITVVSFRGLTDPVVPYAGGNPPAPPSSYPLDPVHFLGAEGTFEKWSELDGCTGDPVEGGGDADWQCRTRASCQGGTEVTLCSGGTTASTGHVQGNAVIAWNTLKRHTLP